MPEKEWLDGVLAFCIHIVYYHSNDYDNYYDYDYFDVSQVCL